MIGKIFRILKTIIKIGIYTLIFIFLALMIPAVQTKLASWVLERINTYYNVNIHIDKVSISLTGMVGLDGVLIRDHHQDTLIAAQSIRTPLLDLKAAMDGNLIFSHIEANELFLNMKTHKGDTLTNLDVFVSRFDSGTPRSKDPFVMRANTIKLRDTHFRVSDYNIAQGENPIQTDIKHIAGTIVDFDIVDSEVKFQMQKGSLTIT